MVRPYLPLISVMLLAALIGCGGNAAPSPTLGTTTGGPVTFTPSSPLTGVEVRFSEAGGTNAVTSPMGKDGGGASAYPGDGDTVGITVNDYLANGDQRGLQLELPSAMRAGDVYALGTEPPARRALYQEFIAARTDFQSWRGEGGSLRVLSREGDTVTVEIAGATFAPMPYETNTARGTFRLDGRFTFVVPPPLPR